MKHSPGFIKIAEEAKKAVKQIEQNELKELIKKKKDFHLLDVREFEEYVNGCIPEAQHLSKGVIERDIEKMIPDPQAHIVLYCGGGSRSALAAENLQRMGYTNVFSLIGGYRGWCQD